MSALTLTIPDNFTHEHEHVTMLVAGVSFYFQRGFDGEGLWYTAERVGNTGPNCMVPLMIQSDLTRLAKEQGLSESHGFSRIPPKPEKKPVSRGPRKPKTPANPLMGSFNPFAG